MKKSSFHLAIQKLLLPLHLHVIHINLGQKINQFFCNKIKARPLWWRFGNYPRLFAQRMSDMHTYGGRCCFITILKNMHVIKNYSSVCVPVPSGVSIFIQEGGEV